MTRPIAAVAAAACCVALAACSPAASSSPTAGPTVAPAPFVTADTGVVLWPQYGDFALEGNKATVPAQNLRFDGDDEGADYMTRIAATPQSRWVGDFTWNDSNSDRVLGVLRAARNQEAIGLLTVAGNPGDACQVPAGEEDAAYATYLEFIEAVAQPLDEFETAVEAWVVFEPGAVATWGDCDGQGRRGDMLAAGIERLAGAGYDVYVDVGSLGGLAPAEAARRLVEDLPIDSIGGFAVGVGSVIALEDQIGFGQAIADELAALGHGDLGFVVDTSRTGVAIDDPEACNPPAAAIGKAPRLVGDGALDAYVWVKRPGESDGLCNGGVTEGQFSPSIALALARNANPEEAR